jgi:hypothetical protein
MRSPSCPCACVSPATSERRKLSSLYSYNLVSDPRENTTSSSSYVVNLLSLCLLLDIGFVNKLLMASVFHAVVEELLDVSISMLSLLYQRKVGS